MGNLQLIVSCFVIFWFCLPSPGHCEVTVFPVSVFPQQAFTNGTVTLSCLATGFDPDVHMFTWQHYVSPYSEVMEDDRISVSPAELDKETSTSYSQNLTITKLTSSDAGSYLCVIVREDTGDIITNGEGRLTVNSTKEFPVCFPDGPAVVNEGDILTCSTVIDERSAMVSDTNSPVERPDWVKTPPAVNDSGSRLQKSVGVSDDGVTFFCFSITPENKKWTSLVCKIGPLTVIPAPTTPKQPLIQPTGEPALPTAVLIVIVVGAFLLLMLLLLLFLLIHTICCRYKPKKYLLNFGGFFSGTIRRRQSSKRLKQTDVELDRQTPDGSDEPNPAEDDRVEFSSEDGADRDVLPIVEIEPNIYEDQGNPGTSFQREDEPEVGGYWDADLKQQLAEAVGEGDFYSD